MKRAGPVIVIEDESPEIFYFFLNCAMKVKVYTSDSLTEISASD